MRDVHWRHPLAGLCKINSDGGIDEAAHRTWIDVVIRDSSGFVIASCTQGIDASFSPLIVEALAIHRNLWLAIDSGFH
ncbi:hypothetical protein ACOSQ2_029420 [Xanthoceras sorbifolium]